MTVFEDWRFRLGELGPADVLEAVANGWQPGALADVNLGAIPVDDDPGRAVRALAGLVDDLRGWKAAGLVSAAGDPAFAALTWIATPTACAWILDYEAPIDRARRSVVLALVADDDGDPLALVRGADGGRTLGAPARPFAAEVFHAVRDAASRFALGCVVDRAERTLDAAAVEAVAEVASRLADRLDGLNSARRPRPPEGGRTPSSQSTEGGTWFVGGSIG